MTTELETKRVSSVCAIHCKCFVARAGVEGKQSEAEGLRPTGNGCQSLAVTAD